MALEATVAIQISGRMTRFIQPLYRQYSQIMVIDTAVKVEIAEGYGFEAGYAYRIFATAAIRQVQP